MLRRFAAALLCLSFGRFAVAEDVKIATYNIELWSKRFDAKDVRAWAKTMPPSDQLTQFVEDHVHENDKKNWEAATVIRAMDPDVMVFEEGCTQDNLVEFDHKWLNDGYAFAHVFPGNSGRGQSVGIIAKPGFKVLKVLEDFYTQPDTVAKDWLKADPEEQKVADGNKLFARGPGFVLFQSPGGNSFWVGVNHEKSKHGNSLDVAKWRSREAIAVHKIIMDVQAMGPTKDVVFGGDMNDEYGLQEFEQEAGGDSIQLIMGPPADGITLATRPLVDSGAFSFGGYYSDRFRSLIDHFFVTPSVKDKVQSVAVFKDGMAPAASDHYPVVLKLKF